METFLLSFLLTFFAKMIHRFRLTFIDTRGARL